jgi:hypothetical protein
MKAQEGTFLFDTNQLVRIASSLGVSPERRLAGNYAIVAPYPYIYNDTFQSNFFDLQALHNIFSLISVKFIVLPYFWIRLSMLILFEVSQMQHDKFRNFP